MLSVAVQLARMNASDLFAPLAVRRSLRGYNHSESDDLAYSSPQRDAEIVGISDLALRCPTGRDIYYKAVQRVDIPAWSRVIGALIDKLLVRLTEEAIEEVESALERHLTGDEFNIDNFRAGLTEYGYAEVEEVMSAWKHTGPDKQLRKLDIEEFAELCYPGGAAEVLKGTRRTLADLVSQEIETLTQHFEKLREETPDWVARIRQSLELQTNVRHLDAVLAKDERRQVMHRLRLNDNIQPDFIFALTFVGDLKTGTHERHYDVLVAGYAIFYEILLRRRINRAVLFYVKPDVDHGRIVERQVRIVDIDDALRTAWRTQRNLSLQIKEQKTVPELPEDRRYCPACPFYSCCYDVNGNPVGRPADGEGGDKV